MNKSILKILPLAAAAVLGAVGICVSDITVLCYIIALYSLFVVDLAADTVTASAVNVLFVFAAAVFGGVSYVITLGLLCVFVAVLMTVVIKRTADFSFTLITGVAGFAAGFMAIDLIAKMSGAGVGLFELFGKTVDSFFSAFTENAGALSSIDGYSQEVIDAMSAYVSMVSEAVKLMLPAMIIIAGAAACVVVLIMSRVLIGGMPVPSLSHIRAPKAFVYAFSLIYIISGLVPEGTASFILSNVSLVLSCCIAFCGFSVVRYLTEKIKSSPLSIIVFIMLIPLCLAASTFLTFIGMADGIFKFRSLGNEKE